MGAVSRKVQLVLLCEDLQHESFARRFLKKAGWDTHRLRVEKGPPSKGSAEQFVRTSFPKELIAYRNRKQHVEHALVFFIDGDQRGVAGRLADLDNECKKQGVAPRLPDEKVAIFVPTWNIETWLAYLDDQRVTESQPNYRKLARERDCQPLVESLYQMCQRGRLRQPAPSSLLAACDEYQSRLP